MSDSPESRSLAGAGTPAKDHNSEGVGVGRARQSAIYREGVFGRTPKVPTDAAELEIRAKGAMSRAAWGYIAGGAGEGATMRANRAAFDRWQLTPRMLHGTTKRDLTTSVLGTDLRAPLMLAPVGAGCLVTDDSDVKIARGAAAAGVALRLLQPRLQRP